MIRKKIMGGGDQAGHRVTAKRRRKMLYRLIFASGTDRGDMPRVQYHRQLVNRRTRLQFNCSSGMDRPG